MRYAQPLAYRLYGYSLGVERQPYLLLRGVVKSELKARGAAAAAAAAAASAASAAAAAASAAAAAASAAASAASAASGAGAGARAKSERGSTAYWRKSPSGSCGLK